MNLDLQSAGAVLGMITAASAVIIPVWTRLGQSRDTAWTRMQTDRDRLDKRVQELEVARTTDRKDFETALKEAQERMDRVEAELDEIRLDRRVLLEFAQDVASGLFDKTWHEQRAKDLLARMGAPAPGGTP